MFMQAALLPRGPPDFVVNAFGREEPMARTGGLIMGDGMGRGGGEGHPFSLPS
jgi:hypothetical protein